MGLMEALELKKIYGYRIMPERTYIDGEEKYRATFAITSFKSGTKTKNDKEEIVLYSPYIYSNEDVAIHELRQTKCAKYFMEMIGELNSRV